MLEKGRRPADNATVPTPGGSNENRDTVKKDLAVEKPVIIVQDESQQKLIDDLKRQLEQIKTNEKLLIRYVDFLLPSLIYFFSKLDLYNKSKIELMGVAVAWLFIRVYHLHRIYNIYSAICKHILLFSKFWVSVRAPL